MNMVAIVASPHFNRWQRMVIWFLYPVFPLMYFLRFYECLQIRLVGTEFNTDAHVFNNLYYSHYLVFFNNNGGAWLKENKFIEGSDFFVIGSDSKKATVSFEPSLLSRTDPGWLW